MKKSELLSYLDSYLKHHEFPHDKSANGLQVASGKEEIKKIAYAVDSTSYIIDKAIEHHVDMLIVHHGMFRGFEQTITGLVHERTKKLLDNDIALYASHLPLDAHEEVGNNRGLLQAWQNIFGLQNTDIQPFGMFDGKAIGFSLRSETAIPLAGIITPFAEKMQLSKHLYNFGRKEHIQSVAIVSGGAGECVVEAHQTNYDLFITGEMTHRQITLAKELKQSILLGGHYETEKIGPKLLAHHLQKTFDLEIVYLDEKY